MTPRSYPEEVAGPYDPPPREFTDREGRAVTIRAFKEGPPPSGSGAESTPGAGSQPEAESTPGAESPSGTESTPDEADTGSGSSSGAAPDHGDTAGGSGAFEALVAMYRAFDPDDRAQGIPPTGESAIRDWLVSITAEGSINVVAWHDGAAVGHATLVPDGRDAAELAIFVLSEYQEAGIGTALIEALLGLGREQGFDRVWLTVERWNEPARQLYRKVGFEITGTDSFEVEMSARLRDGDADDGPDANR